MVPQVSPGQLAQQGLLGLWGTAAQQGVRVAPERLAPPGQLGQRETLAQQVPRGRVPLELRGLLAPQGPLAARVAQGEQEPQVPQGLLAVLGPLGIQGPQDRRATPDQQARALLGAQFLRSGFNSMGSRAGTCGQAQQATQALR